VKIADAPIFLDAQKSDPGGSGRGGDKAGRDPQGTPGRPLRAALISNNIFARGVSRRGVVMEEIKPRGRPRKPRVGILSAEQVLALQTPQQIATAEARERERLRGIARRAEKKVLDSMSEAEDIQQFWAESLKLADAQKLAEWRERQECVLDTMHWMESWMSGTYNVSPSETEYYVGIEEGDEDLRRDIAEHGVCGATPVLLVGKFWQDSALLAQLTNSERRVAGGSGMPSAIFAKFGILTALPDLRVHQWEQFMARHRAATSPATPPPPGNGYTTLRCKCGSQPEAMQQSIADRYRELGQEFFCSRCRDLERKSRAESTLYRGSK
jgi:hypothetical protein